MGIKGFGRGKKSLGKDEKHVGGDKAFGRHNVKICVRGWTLTGLDQAPKAPSFYLSNLMT